MLRVERIDPETEGRVICSATVGPTAIRFRDFAREGVPPRCVMVARYRVNGCALCQRHAGIRAIDLSVAHAEASDRQSNDIDPHRDDNSKPAGATE